MIASNALTDHIKGIFGTLLAPAASRSQRTAIDADQPRISELQSAAQLDSLIDKEAKLVIQFHASWCGPCDQQLDRIENLTDGSSVRVVRIDVDSFPELAEEQDVQLIPTLIVLQDGVPSFRASGLRSDAELADALA